ncbi:GDP-mannose 4 [Abeliophyllum distichum]|uniref:GDP-mannose 4,6-dehydratase n=1 Tax=Abeliophyllum distichum TaxID=126358 RepID=A0ABD1URH9_9LAMI
MYPSFKSPFSTSPYLPFLPHPIQPHHFTVWLQTAMSPLTQDQNTLPANGIENPVSSPSPPLQSIRYEIHGLIRRSSNFNTQWINHIYIDPHNANKARIKLHYADLTDASSLRRWFDTIQPDEVYNLALLTLLQLVPFVFWRQSSPTYPPLEDPIFVIIKQYTVNYREAYRIFACNDILFNHESPRMGKNFVTRKITRAVGRIKIILQSKLFLGNLQASRDWGFAEDYVEAMYVGLKWKDHVVIDKWYIRPAEVDNLKEVATKSKKVLGWKPKVGFEQRTKMMVDEDIELAKRERFLVDAGYMDAHQQP